MPLILGGIDPPLPTELIAVTEMLDNDNLSVSISTRPSLIGGVIGFRFLGCSTCPPSANARFVLSWVLTDRL
jgi:hypothetical protein